MKRNGNGRVVGTTKFRGDEYEDDGPVTPEDIENDKKEHIQILRSGQSAGLSKEQGWTFLELESPYITKVTNETAIDYNRNHYYHVTGAGMMARVIEPDTNFVGMVKVSVADKIKKILVEDANAIILQVLDKSITSGGRRSRNQRKSRRSRKQRNERKSRKQRRSRR